MKRINQAKIKNFMNSDACSHMQSRDLPKEEIIKCFHCGNETLMAQKGEYCWGSRYIEYENFCFSYKYELFACPVCHKVTLRETYSDKQYDGFLLDNIEDWDDLIALLEAKEYDETLALAQRKRAKNQNKLESPTGNN